MENASKAILIAGGVLLAIIVISICMLVISNAREAFVSMEERRQAQIIQEQTAKFANYVGQEIYGTEVNNCRKRALSYNDTNSGPDITVNINGISGNINDSGNLILKFRGEMTTNDDGTIQLITFTKI